MAPSEISPTDLDPAASPASPSSTDPPSQPITQHNADLPPTPEPEPLVESASPPEPEHKPPGESTSTQTPTTQPNADPPKPKEPEPLVESSSPPPPEPEHKPLEAPTQTPTKHNADSPPPPEPEPEPEACVDSASPTPPLEPEQKPPEKSTSPTQSPTKHNVDPPPPPEPEQKPREESTSPTQSSSKPNVATPPPPTTSPPASSEASSPPLSPKSPPPSKPQLTQPSPPPLPEPSKAPPPIISTTNEITNADPTDQPIHEQQDTNTMDDTTCNMLAFLKKKKKKNQIAVEDSATNKGGSSSGRSISEAAIESERHRLEKKLHHMNQDLTKLNQFEQNLHESTQGIQSQVDALSKRLQSVKTRKEVERAKRDLKMLQATIPSPHKLSLAKSKSSAQQALAKRYQDEEDQEDATLPDLLSDETFLHSSEFQEYKHLFDNQLNNHERRCLLCFAVFPKNEVIKKRLIIYFWVGEGFLEYNKQEDDNPPDEDQDPKIQNQFEDRAEKILKKLVETRFIEPVYKKRRQEVHSFKMHPVTHSAVKILAETIKFFEYDSKWKSNTNPQVERACLVQPEESYDAEDEKDLLLALYKVQGLELEKIKTLFNISKMILDFSFEWFKKLKNLRVLYLGRWQTSPKHHVEVESTEFLKGFKKMKSLRFLSLQGISRIFDLPKMLSRLTSLMILDLRACHNLEVLPKEIGMLRKLTHLDISECYMLDRVPKEIATLSELQVLKGFVVACVPNDKSCTLKQLVALGKLQKLSITTNNKTFPNQVHLNALQNMQQLTNLRIIWGYDFKHKMKETSRAASESESPHNDNNPANPNIRVSCTEPPKNDKAEVSRSPPLGTSSSSNDNKGFLENLKKLDLQCYPEKQTPNWLMPFHVKNLEKLYIKGGELQKLSPSRIEDKWEKVEIMCLKFSRNLRIEWKEVQASFPKLCYLEKVRCPNLNLFPCDDEGIWINNGTKTAATRI